MKKILCLILFLSSVSLVFGADINLCIQAGATESENLISYTSVSGSVSNINDDDEGTFRKVSHITGPGGGGILEFEHDIDFGQNASTINSIEVVSTAEVNYGSITSFKVYLYYNSVWNLVFTGSTGAWAKKTDTQSGPWNNVTKIRLYVLGEHFHLTIINGVILDNFELRAWGVIYQDIGLRVRTSGGTIKIGVLDLDDATHKLRIRKGNTTYGIPLLATNDADASGVRIYDGSAVKALPKVD